MVFWLEPSRRTLEPDDKVGPIDRERKVWTVFQNCGRTQGAYERDRVIDGERDGRAKFRRPTAFISDRDLGRACVGDVGSGNLRSQLSAARRRLSVVVTRSTHRRSQEDHRSQLPFTVSVNAGPPAMAEFGARLEMTGAA